MTDPEVIKKYYASLYDDELIHIAKTEASELTPEALSILKQELKSRWLNTDIIDLDKENNKNVEEQIADGEPIVKLDNSPIGGAGTGLQYDQMMYEKEPVPENILPGKEETLTVEQMQDHLNKASASMNFNGIIFFIGLVVTIGSLVAATDHGGTVVLAWGAIFYGGARFFSSWLARNKYRSMLETTKTVSDKNIEEKD